MSDHGRQPQDERPRPGEPFLARFHRRKLEARGTAATASDEDAAARSDRSQTQDCAAAAGNDLPLAPDATGAEPTPPSDVDMPPLESLTADSDYSGFLSPRVSEGLRRAALRRLFHGAEFNVVDGLDEYADDFTRFETLGEIVTADMRHLLEVQARRQAEALKQALLDDGGTVAEAGEPAAPAVDVRSATAGADDLPEPPVDT